MYWRNYKLNRMAVTIECLGREDLLATDKAAIVHASSISCSGDLEKLFKEENPLKSKYEELLEDLKACSSSFYRYIMTESPSGDDGGVCTYCKTAQCTLYQMLNLMIPNIGERLTILNQVSG